MKQIVQDGVELHLANPVEVKQDWIGQEEPLRQLLACWLSLSAGDHPLSPRIVGVPGLGKTTLAMAAAKRLGREVYIHQCTADTRPEDLLITPVLGQDGRILYHASALVTAMITGGAAVLDEGNRMSEKSWASLTPLLDDRRLIESIVAGITIKAHPDFRCVVTMNDDSSVFEIPDYIMSRLQPAIEISFPGDEEELAILKYNLPEAPEELLKICLGFLQKAHALDLPYSIRDGLSVIRYAHRLHVTTREPLEAAFTRAVRQVIGEDALNLDQVAERRRAQGEDLQRMQMGDFFFDEDDPLHPDRQG